MVFAEASDRPNDGFALSKDTDNILWFTLVQTTNLIAKEIIYLKCPLIVTEL